MQTALITMPLGSEVRQFGHSGMVTQLLDAGWRVVLAVSIVDDDVRAQLDDRAEIVPLPKDKPTLAQSQLQMMLDNANAQRAASNWQYVSEPAQNWKGQLLKRNRQVFTGLMSIAPPAYKAGAALEQRLLAQYHTSAWAALLDDVQPDVMVVNLPRGGRLEVGLAQAAKRNIALVLLYHTWKDVSVASGRHVVRFDAVGVWNEWMRDALLHQNPSLDPATVHQVGCAHFDCVGRDDRLIERGAFMQQLGLPVDARYILFTASAPWVVPGEEYYLRLLQDAIDAGQLPSDLHIVVRTNPMDEDGLLRDTLAQVLPQVRVSTADWRWQKEDNWCFQRFDDQLLYNSLLHYAAVNVSVSSTVTVECAVSRLPVINLGFDVPGQPPLNGSVRNFWLADFYQMVRDSGAAQLADTPDDLLHLVQQALDNRAWLSDQQAALLDQQLSVPPGQAAAAGVALIQQTAQ